MPTSIGRARVQGLIAAGAAIVDVLPPGEFKKSHLPGAVSIPLPKLDREATAGLDRDRPVVVYCFDTQRDLSPRAAWRLEDLGFRQVYDYVAGKLDWLAHGLPFEGEDAKEPRAADRMRRDAPTCALADRLGAVRERVKAAGWDSCVVVNEQRVVLGLLRERQLGGDPEASAESAMVLGPSTSRPHAPLSDLQEYFEEHDVSTATITTSDGVLLGLLRRADC